MTRQSGATLIEVLITLLILKVGLLGVLAAQLQALRMATEATQRTSVVALSRDILHQLSFYRDPAASYHIEHNVGVVSCSATSPCYGGDSRQYLIYHWQQQFRSDQGYGLLYEPVFCLRQQQGQLALEASWQARIEPLVQEPSTCQSGLGRGLFRLGFQE